MNDLQRVLSDILFTSDHYWSSCVGNSGISQNDVVAMASDMRVSLLNAIEHATSLHDSNLQCMAQVMALKREKAKSDNNNFKQIQTLQDKVNSLLEIIERRPSSSSSSSKSNFDSLKGLWLKLLSPVLASNDHFVELNNREKLDYEENCSISLSLLTNQCVSEVYSEYHGLQSNNDKTSSFVFLRMINKVSNLCNHVSEVHGEISRLEVDNDRLKHALRESMTENVDLSRQLAAVVRQSEKHSLICDQYEKKIAQLSNQLDQQEKALSKVLTKSLKESQKCVDLEKQLSHTQTLYHQSMKLCNEWKIFCEEEGGGGAANKGVRSLPPQPPPVPSSKIQEIANGKMSTSTSVGGRKVFTLADIADDQFDNSSQRSGVSSVTREAIASSVPTIVGGSGAVIDSVSGAAMLSKANRPLAVSAHSTPSSSSASLQSQMSSPLMSDLYELRKLPLDAAAAPRHNLSDAVTHSDRDYSGFHSSPHRISHQDRRMVVNEVEVSGGSSARDAVDEDEEDSSSGSGVYDDTFITSPSKTRPASLRAYQSVPLNHLRSLPVSVTVAPVVQDSRNEVESPLDPPSICDSLDGD